MRVLVLNPGSSSLKSSVVEADASAIGTAASAAPEAAAGTESAAPADGRFPPAPGALARLGVDWGVDATAGHDPADDLRALLRRYEAAGVPPDTLGGVGYRVVHGGSRFRAPALIGADVVREVDDLRSLAPLHNGIAAATMAAGLVAIPNLPHVAVFDTAFHATIPEVGYRYAVPEEWYAEWGVRRYGFHGLSVAWSAERAAAMLGRPVGDVCSVVAHLGSGCSVTAVEGGRSVSTSMGLTPLEGLMMGTRAGSIDPGIVFYLLRQGARTVPDIADELDHRSGLLGVSGRTSDVRDLLRLEASGDRAATLALAMFVRRAAEAIAAAATSLPRVDALVFTGGIGENAGSLRTRIVARLAPLGFRPIADESVREDAILAPAAVAGAGRNASGSDGHDGPVVLRIEAREDVVVARETARTISDATPRAVERPAGETTPAPAASSGEQEHAR